MDLLDLHLDLNAEGTSSSGRVTRRSQAAAPAVATPKAQPKTPKKSSTTPKAAATTTKTPVKTPAKTPKPSEAKKTPAKKTPAKKAKIVEEELAIEEEAAVKEEPASEETRSSSQESRGRSPSLDKRSRHKAKKRFSPSPVAKKRKTMTTSTPTTPAVAPKKKKSTATPQQEDLDASIESVRSEVEKLGEQNYDIPDEWKPSPDSSNIGEDAIVAAPATSTTQTPKPAKKGNGTSKKDQAATVARGRMSTSAAPEDSPEEIKQAKPRSSSVRKESTETNRRRSRKVVEKEEEEQAKKEEKVVEDAQEVKKKTPARRKSTVTFALKVQDNEPSTSEAPLNPNSALAIKKRLLGEATAPKPADKKIKKAARAAAEVAEDPEEPAPVQEEVEKEVKEEVKEEAEKEVKEATVDVPPASPEVKESKKPASVPAPAATVAAAPTPTRASGRVSKPNRLYIDSTFNTEVLGRTRVTEQNPAKEQAQEPEEIPLPTSSRRKAGPSASAATPSTPRPPPTPKPVPVINGVLRGYVPSVKIPLEDYEVEGVVVKLNEEVNEVLDVLLFKVCEDGLVKHEDIDPKVVKAKIKAKIDHTKRMRLQARKLDIQMNAAVKTPSTSDEIGKRKRQAPRALDDMYWTPPVNRQKPKERSEEPEVSPALVDYEEEEEEEPVPKEERRQQKARRSISNLFDAEMDASIKEAKNYTVRFDSYIKPKLNYAQKNSKIKLMSRKRQSADPDDFYYHELLADQVSPSTSNVENEGGGEPEIDVVVGVDAEPEEVPTEQAIIELRTAALDIAEQVIVILPRPTRHDGKPFSLEHLQTKAMEHLEPRQLVLNDAVTIVLNQFTYESTPPTRSVDEQGCMWHTITSANAQELKNLFAMTDSNREDAICWAHLFLLENLPVNYLASYLSVLRYAKRMFQDPARIQYIINSTKDDNDVDWGQVTSIVKAFAHKKYNEPGTDLLKGTIPLHRFENTVFLLVPPTLTIGDQKQHHRQQYGRIFRWLQSIGHPDSELISCTEHVDATCSVAEYLSDVVVDKICTSVKQRNLERPHCKVVLVGYGASTYLVHRAANLVGGISAIISIGFPVMSPLGRRGTADDEILLTYCPTLFIVGAEGKRFNSRAMAEMRESMIANTGLVVVGHASDTLLVPTSMLLRIGISQTVVYRMMLEKIMDFLSLPALRDQSNSELNPIELNNIFELDSSFLKGDKGLSGLVFASTPSSPSPSPVGLSGRRATVSGSEESYKKKRDPPYLLTSSGGPLTPSPRSDDFLAFQNLMTSSVATADDMPRRASMSASPRVIERGDFRAPRPSVQSPRGPLDPASISLN
ncbi:hypothetical protein L5515_006111 [Caenorhabditis briggsae]|uniref:KANSL3 helical domain-containing protein n=1 Tax=Caenorhabditis briggsae TaxID=6238 RepID=A0AAE9JKH3_CAEBR|nr:hypothetical protein L5515_006111 [Caenorhabditis briggsae]